MDDDLGVRKIIDGYEKVIEEKDRLRRRVINLENVVREYWPSLTEITKNGVKAIIDDIMKGIKIALNGDSNTLMS